MLAEKGREDGPRGPGRPGKRRRRRPGRSAAEPGRDEQPVRKRPRGRRRPDTGSGGARGAVGAAPPPPPHPVSPVSPEAGALSGRQQKKKRRRRRKGGAGGGEEEPVAEPEPPAAPSPPVPSAGSRSAALRARMEDRLLGARFRLLNQRLYGCSSREAARLFRRDPRAFPLYHRGFARQLARWPESPRDRILRCLRRRPSSLVVADLGCGDCALARSLPNKVHSFDLVALSPLVTVCDVAQLPLEDESIDVGVFCLSLMCTNLQEILEEANRVLKLGGTLMVAEVASRFEDMRAFLSAMAQLGFKSVSKDLSSPFFYLLEFSKSGPPRGRPVPGLRLRPCLYKRR